MRLSSYSGYAPRVLMFTALAFPERVAIDTVSGAFVGVLDGFTPADFGEKKTAVGRVLEL